MAIDIPFPPAALQETLYWGRFFADEWRRDPPPQMMHSASLTDDGTPQWTSAFAGWISNAPGEEERHRTTAVMRRLRRIAPREFEVLWRTLLLGETIEQTTDWLNERAKRNDIPLPNGREVHYRLKDTVALMMAGVGFAQAYW